MRPCRFSRIEAILFGLHINFYSINANLDTCENALAPKKWGRREYLEWPNLPFGLDLVRLIRAGFTNCLHAFSF